MIQFPDGTKVWYTNAVGERIQAMVLGPYDGDISHLKGYLKVELQDGVSPGPAILHPRTLSVREADNGESEHPCFEAGERESGTCQGDGWFMCHECRLLDPNSVMLAYD